MESPILFGEEWCGRMVWLLGGRGERRERRGKGGGEQYWEGWTDRKVEQRIYEVTPNCQDDCPATELSGITRSAPHQNQAG